MFPFTLGRFSSVDVHKSQQLGGFHGDFPPLVGGFTVTSHRGYVIFMVISHHRQRDFTVNLIFASLL